uniref:Ig-like domain-containing protein n=1 Tax=Meloidogyne hapla TaxID=6305 RepID=A0A1I8BG09_MELHA
TGLCVANCREGDTLRLKAVLLGEPMLEVSWLINGNKLVESQNCKITTAGTTYIVLIRIITQDYSGSVVCDAVNEFGKASSQAILKVLPQGERIHKVVYTGKPRPSISWFINSQEIVSSTEENTSTLTMRSFNPERHVGEIICKAENNAGEVSCTANMATYTSDMFTESESGSQIQRFTVDIKQYLNVLSQTLKVFVVNDGMEIELIARIRVQMQTIEGFTTSELVINVVEPEDVDKYAVIVENEAGRASLLLCNFKKFHVLTFDANFDVFNS